MKRLIYYIVFVFGFGSSVMCPQAVSSRATSLIMQSGLNMVFTGDCINAGAISAGSNSQFIFSGTTDQTFEGSGNENFSNILINKSSGNLVLNSSLTVNGKLTLSRGNIIIGDNTLNISAEGGMEGNLSNTAMIAAGENGKLKKYLNSPGTFVYPIGSAADAPVYSPVTIIVDSGQFSSAWISVKLAAKKNPDNTSVTNYLKRYWTLESSGLSNPKYSAVFKYSPSDIAGNGADLHASRRYDGIWNYIDTVDDINNTFTGANLNSFGVFTAGESEAMGGAVRINLSVIPEGYLNTELNRLSMRDTFRVYLANNAPPYNLVDSALTLIDSLTFSGTASFKNAQSGVYYIVVRHRNSVETWSKLNGESFQKGAVSSYDFTASAVKAYGSNLKLKGSKYCIYSGDVNQDGAVDFSDLVKIDNASSGYLTGYAVEDINGDRLVDFSDLVICDNNSSNYIGVKKPSVSAKVKESNGQKESDMSGESSSK